MKTKQRRKDRREKFLGMDFAMHGMCVFSTGEEPDIPCFTGMQRKNLPGNRESFPDVKRAAVTIRNRRKRLLLYHER